MKINSENLIKIIREEALGKYVKNNMSQVKNLIERGSVVEQTGLLRGPDVARFQEDLLSRLGLNASTLTSEAGKADFKSTFMDGNAMYGRPSSTAPDSEYVAARNSFTSELSRNILGRYTHRLWELWVDANYDPANENLVRIMNSALVQDWIRGEIGGQAAIPGKSSVKNAWESSARSLGYDITATRGTISGVRAAIQFMEDLKKEKLGGFSTDTWAKIQAKALEDEAAAEEEGVEDIDTQPDPGVVVVDSSLPPIGVSQRAGESPAAFEARKKSYQTKLDRQFQTALTSLGLTTSTLVGVRIGISDIKTYEGNENWSAIADLYVTPPRVARTRRGNTVTAARSVHPVIRKPDAIKRLADIVEKMVDKDRMVPGDNDDMNAKSFLSLFHIIKWLGGDPGGSAGSASATVGSGNLNRHGRVGVLKNGFIYDALSMFYSHFEGEGGLAKLIANADIDGVYGGGSERKFKQPITNLMETLNTRFQIQGQAPDVNPGTVKKNAWNAKDASKYTKKVRRHLERLDESDNKKLDNIIEKTIKESFGVNKFVQPTITVVEPEPATPPAAIESPTKAFRRGFSDGEDTVGKIQRFLGIAQTGIWDPNTDNAFIYYINAGFRGPTNLKILAGNRPWAEVSSDPIASRSGLTSGPLGAYNFITSTKWFPSQKRRIKNHFREERKRDKSLEGAR